MHDTTHLLAARGVWHRGQCTSKTGDSSPILCNRVCGVVRYGVVRVWYVGGACVV